MKVKLVASLIVIKGHNIFMSMTNKSVDKFLSLNKFQTKTLIIQIMKARVSIAERRARKCYY